MVIVQVKRGAPPFQVEDFGKDVPRTRKGAIHFRPGSVEELTDGEFEHISKKHPKFAARLRVLRLPSRSPRPDKPPKAEPKTETPVEVPPEVPSEPPEEPSDSGSVEEGGEVEGASVEEGPSSGEDGEKKTGKKKKRRKSR